MADKIFENLKKEQESKVALTNKISLLASDDEIDLIQKKADALGMSVEELMRIYVLQTSAFDPSPFEEKKKKTQSKKSNEVIQ